MPTSGDLGKILEGERLGHFHLEKFIGGGGMGAVFRGTDEMLGRTVAIKVLSPQQGADDETTRRFRHEAQSTARLDHDHIARVYYVGVDRGWHYIVLEYVEGENLRDLVAFNGPLPFADVISYTLQISEALGHASGRDVVHRDIKPSNVLITTTNQAKLVDMGLARLHQVDNPEDDLTASGVTLGTFDYISPEQARDPRVADVRSDLYSLGCTVYFMLTGRPPFPQGTVLQKLLQHQGDTPPDPRRFRPDVPEDICRVTAKLLAKNPAHRYQQPQELIHELVAVSHQLDLPVISPTVEEWSPAPAQPNVRLSRHLPWLIPVAILLAVVSFTYLRDGLQSKTLSDTVEPDTLRSTAGPGGSSPARQSTDSDEQSTSEADPSATDAADSTTRKTSGPGASMESATNVEDKPTGAEESTGESLPADGATDNKGAESTSSETGTKRSSPIADSMRVIIVSDQGDANHRDLATAVREAPDSATIELRYDGHGGADQLPLTLEEKQLTIRGGEGYAPILRFRPQQKANSARSRAQIQVLRGRLTLANVHLELDVADTSVPSGSSLIEATQADRIELRSCTITVSDQRDSTREFRTRPSVFHIAATSYQSAFSEAPATQMDDIAIDIEDCIIRGGANFLTGKALGTVDLRWRNGLLAVDGRFVEIEATEDGGQQRGRLQISLEHVTANARRGFCYMSGGDDARYFPTLKLTCVDSILLTAGAPFIEQYSWHGKNELEEIIRWSGHNNFFDGFDIFWQLDSDYSAVTEQLDWNAWKAHWPMGSDGSQAGVSWRRPIDTSDNTAQHRAEDYRLRAGDNSAIGGATDGMSNVGLRLDELPYLPDAETSDAE